MNRLQRKSASPVEIHAIFAVYVTIPSNAALQVLQKQSELIQRSTSNIFTYLIIV